VNDAVNLRVRSEDAIECGLVGDVGLVENRALAADELDAVDGDLGRVVEVVNNHDIVAVLKKRERGKRPNVAGASGYVSQSRLRAFARGGSRGQCWRGFRRLRACA